jgi:protein gp37
MADNTHIEWTDATWNPITGCSVVSPGCTNCYAMKLAGTRLQHEPSRKGLTKPGKAGPVWTGEVRFNQQWLDQPLRWKRPRKIFVCAHGDLFAENVPDEWIDQVFAVMLLAGHHIYQILTKRHQRMRAYIASRSIPDDRGYPAANIRAYVNTWLNDPNWRQKHRDWARLIPEGQNLFSMSWPLPNVWLGVSVEDQARANERIPDLLATPAAVRWISAEPLLGPIDLRSLTIDGEYEMDAISPLSWRELWDGHFSPEATGCNLDEAIEAFAESSGTYPPTDDKPASLDWVVVGGESGPGARPMHPDWVRSLRDQCAEAGIPFFFKQWGNWLPAERIEDGGKPTWDAEYGAAEEGSFGGVRARLTQLGNQDFASVGKARAGRLLDGIEHNGCPEVQS